MNHIKSLESLKKLLELLEILTQYAKFSCKHFPEKLF